MSSDFQRHLDGAFGPHEVTLLREVYARLLSLYGRLLKDAGPDQVARLVMSTDAAAPRDVEAVIEICLSKLGTIVMFSRLSLDE